jgi:hypothetical protein
MLIVSAGAALAATSTAVAPPAMESDLSALEIRLFEHDYQSDSADNRLSRLEKMVFGEAKTGSEQHRLTELLTSMPTPAPQLAPVVDVSAGPAAQSDFRTDQASPATAPGTGDQITDSSQYPHVTALEHELLNRTFVDQPVNKRLDQLETKAFGKPSNSTDLSYRVDKLEQYVDTHMHVRPFGTNPDMEVADLAPIYDTEDGAAPAAIPASYGVPSSPKGSPRFVASPASSSSLLDKVAWMEGQVFGQAYSDEHLLSRLRRLEQHLFPNEHPTSDMQLMDRVDPLMGAVQLLQHQRQQTSAPQYIASSTGAQTALHSQPAASDASQGDNAKAAHDSRHPYMKSLAECLGAAGNMGMGTTGNAVGGPWY